MHSGRYEGSKGLHRLFVNFNFTRTISICSLPFLSLLCIDRRLIGVVFDCAQDLFLVQRSFLVVFGKPCAVPRIKPAWTMYKESIILVLSLQLSLGLISQAPMPMFQPLKRRGLSQVTDITSPTSPTPVWQFPKGRRPWAGPNELSSKLIKWSFFQSSDFMVPLVPNLLFATEHLSIYVII